jgi:hypothetical protein
MKKLCFSIAALFFCLVCGAMPNEKVLNNFTASFPQADSVSWYENDNSYEVHFVMGAVRCRLWYDHDGSVTKSIRYYSQDMLPPMIRCNVCHRFMGQKIYGVTELTGEEGLQYFLILEDEKKWYEVTSDAAGNLTLTRKFNKT